MRIKSFLFLALNIVFLNSALATPSANTPVPRATPTKSLSSLLDISDLTLEMAENRFKLKADQNSAASYIVALEKFLDKNCFPEDLHRKFKYEGNPTNPTCFENMSKLLKLDPMNPVGLCVKDGMQSESCIKGYANQQTVVYDGSQDVLLTDPILKKGLSPPDFEKFKSMSNSINELAVKREQAEAPEDKAAIDLEAKGIYEKIMSLSCALNTTLLVPAVQATPSPEERRVEEVRARLLDIPTDLRKDYQTKMRREYEDSFANAKTASDKELIKKILDVIDNPTPAHSGFEFKRSRILHPACAETLDIVSKFDPNMPQPTCYNVGWYSPQCLRAIQMSVKAKRTGSGTKTSDSEAVISTF